MKNTGRNTKLFIGISAVIALFTLVSCYSTNANRDQSKKDTMADFYGFKVEALDGSTIDFADLKGKKVLIVNVASKCGYTPQYDDLQALHTKHGDKVTIIGFPANNFGGQEPGTNSEIATFCKKNYGVSFTMASKVSVIGDDIHPLYDWLAVQTNKQPNWNFCKYLIDENGKAIAFYKSGINPMDEEIVSQL